MAYNSTTQDEERRIDLTPFIGTYTVDEAKEIIKKIGNLIGDDCKHTWVKQPNVYSETTNKSVWKCCRCGKLSTHKPK